MATVTSSPAHMSLLLIINCQLTSYPSSFSFVSQEPESSSFQCSVLGQYDSGSPGIHSLFVFVGKLRHTTKMS